MPYPTGREPRGSPFDFNPRGGVNPPLRNPRLRRGFTALIAPPHCVGPHIAGLAYFSVQPMGMNSSLNRSTAKGSVMPAM